MERVGEYPITKFWYGKGARFRSIEELIDQDPDWFLWALSSFQNVTVEQANHFKEKYGMDLPSWAIEDVPPYEYRKGDVPQLYTDLCKFPRPGLDHILEKYRGCNSDS